MCFGHHLLGQLALFACRDERLLLSSKKLNLQLRNFPRLFLLCCRFFLHGLFHRILWLLHSFCHFFLILKQVQCLTFVQILPFKRHDLLCLVRRLLCFIKLLVTESGNANRPLRHQVDLALSKDGLVVLRRWMLLCNRLVKGRELIVELRNS